MKLHYIITSALLLAAGFVQAAQGNKKQKTEGEQQVQVAPQQLTHEEEIAHNKLIAQALAEQKAHVQVTEQQQQKKEQVMLNAEQVRDQELKRLAGIKRKNIDNALVNDAWLAEATTITIPELQKLIREYYINPIEYLSLVYPPSNLVQEELDDHLRDIKSSSLVLNPLTTGGDNDGIQINKQGMIWHSCNLYTMDNSQKIDFFNKIENARAFFDDGGSNNNADYARSILRNDNRIIITPGKSFTEQNKQAIATLILNSDGSLYKQLVGHSDFVSCIATNSDNITVTGSYDKTTKVWDADGKLFKTLDAGGKVTAVAISDDGVIICGREDGVCRVWRSESAECYELSYQIMDERQYPITRIILYSGNKFITKSKCACNKFDCNKKALALWTFNKHGQATPKYDLTIIPHDIYAVAFASDGALAIARSKAKEETSVISLWNLDKPQAPQCLRSFEIKDKAYNLTITHDNSIMCTYYDGRKTFIALLDFDGTMIRYELESEPGLPYNLGIDGTLYAEVGSSDTMLITLKPDLQKLSHLQNLSLEQLATLRSLLKELYTNRVLSPQQEEVLLSLWKAADGDLDRSLELTLSFDKLAPLFPILNDLKRRNIDSQTSQEDAALLNSLYQTLRQEKPLPAPYPKGWLHTPQTIQQYHTQVKALHSLLTRLLDMRRYVFSKQHINLFFSLPQLLQQTVCQRFNLTAEDFERWRKQMNESKESKESKEEQKQQ